MKIITAFFLLSLSCHAVHGQSIYWDSVDSTTGNRTLATTELPLTGSLMIPLLQVKGSVLIQNRDTAFVIGFVTANELDHKKENPDSLIRECLVTTESGTNIRGEWLWTQPARPSIGRTESSYKVSVFKFSLRDILLLRNSNVTEVRFATGDNLFVYLLVDKKKRDNVQKVLKVLIQTNR